MTRWYLSPDVGFDGDRIAWWSPLDAESALALDTVIQGSTGYPLNAVVATLAPGELGLAHGLDLTPHVHHAIADSAIAIIASVFDNEADLSLTRESLI